MENNSVLMFNNVSKYIKNNQILKNISFDAKKGEVIGIIGSNGSGKTTLLRLACGLVYSTHGEIYINNKLIRAGFMGNLPSKVGILIESPSFMGELSGIENLLYLAKIRNDIKKEDIIKSLDDMDLDYTNKNPVKTYSLGMRQRLGIVQAVMEKPDIVLLDEPTNGLDSSAVELFESLIKKYKERGTCFILVSHNMYEIKRFCDRVFRITDGELSQEENLKKYNIMLNTLEDLEIVLKSVPKSQIGERHRGNPVVTVTYESYEKLKSLLSNLNIDYTLLKEN